MTEANKPVGVVMFSDEEPFLERLVEEFPINDTSVFPTRDRSQSKSGIESSDGFRYLGPREVILTL